MQNRRPAIRIFNLIRDEDKSGVSGTGLVAVGVVFPSGKVVLEWLGLYSTFGIYNNLADVERIHGHGGKTRVVFVTTEEHALKTLRPRLSSEWSDWSDSADKKAIPKF